MQTIALSCDDSYISLLYSTHDDDDDQDMNNDHSTLIPDEKYAQSLQLQEALMASFFITSQIKPEKHDIQKGSKELGESSQTTCEICAEKKDRYQMFTVQNCTHRYCTECISKHITIKLQKRSQLEKACVFSCPGLDCKGVLSIDNCREILGNDVIIAWDDMICESMIDPKQRFYCPYKNCSALLVNDNGGGGVVREAECPYCRRLFCAKCYVPWHCGVECEDLDSEKRVKREDMMVIELAKKQKWQKCPSCMFFVEKIDGCLHMTCRCGYQFCYACGATWSTTHGGRCR